MTTQDIALLIGCLLPVTLCIYTDARSYILPNWLTGSIIISGLTAAVLLGRVPDALAGALLAGGVFLFACLSGGAGGGDLKLATGIGIWFGFYGGALIIIAGCLLGAAWGIFKMAKDGTLKKWLKTTGVGAYLRLSGIRGTITLDRIPEDASKPMPANVVPFGTFLGISTWGYFLMSLNDVGGLLIQALSGI